MTHICHRSNVCTCSIVGTEPDEECPIHGAAKWPPRCSDCGRFMPWLENYAAEERLIQDILNQSKSPYGN